jgi:type I restriction enzyme S subunit
MTLANPIAEWRTSRLDEVAEIIRGISFPTSAKAYKPANGLIACLRTTNVQRDVEWADLWFVSESYVRNNAQIVRESDILISNANSLALVGKVALVRNVESRATLGAFITLFRAKGTVDPRFLYYQLASAEVQAAIRRTASTTTNISNVSSTKLAQIELRLAPLPEQHRIVAEIEKQFTRLDTGVAALRRAQANLKRYRASVLKAACEGKLVPTEAELARAEGREFESGAALLERILVERRNSWAGRGTYKEPAAPDVAGLPELPEGWCWATLNALTEVKGGITKDQNRKHSEPARSVPYLRVANVQRGYLDLSEIKEIVATEDDIRELALRPGDLLFNEGGDRDKLGRGWVWNGEIPDCIHQNHVFRARPFDAALAPKFVSWYANTFGQKFFFDEGKHTTNLASISMTKLKELPVPIPPPAEQQRIVAEVERRLSVVDELEAVVSANLLRAARLRQAVLQRAFSGEL